MLCIFDIAVLERKMVRMTHRQHKVFDANHLLANTVSGSESGEKTQHDFQTGALLLRKRIDGRVQIGTLVGTPYKDDTQLVKKGAEFDNPLATEDEDESE